MSLGGSASAKLVLFGKCHNPLSVFASFCYLQSERYTCVKSHFPLSPACPPQAGAAVCRFFNPLLPGAILVM
jgi:hypothetical protein